VVSLRSIADAMVLFIVEQIYIKTDILSDTQIEACDRSSCARRGAAAMSVVEAGAGRPRSRRLRPRGGAGRAGIAMEMAVLQDMQSLELRAELHTSPFSEPRAAPIASRRCAFDEPLSACVRCGAG